ncbi:V-type proton ATPase subunit S1 [Bicyclus anynana]|uniref:V-type proton ATPase subunit S1 n=1 Tax=Bicyclus anynana TaxID=110368 RepID=A0A6J1MYV6_BICAN|nr:V-type proton ATPase subunit S1 [Bicyclus anynana]
MAYCRLVLAFLVICIASTYGEVQVPVFIWGDLKTSSKANPLSRVTEPEFNGLLKKQLAGDPFTVVFIDKTLSVEDFSIKDDEGESVFPYLHSLISGATYLPAVDDPLPVLNRLADPENVRRVKVTENGLSAEIESDSGKMLFIQLKDAKADESRADLLRRHNDLMENMYNKLVEQYKDVVAIYTAENPSWTVSESHERFRRDVRNTDLQNGTFDGLKLYVNKVLLNVDSVETNVTTIDSASSVINENQNMSTTLTFGDVSLTLNFLSKAGYWYFSSVTYQQASRVVGLLPQNELFVPLGFSYRCGQDLTFSNTTNQTVIVQFRDIKVQPYFAESNETLVYGDSINCVGFFSVPIWSGLFVVFILLAITFYGIMMMMDIRTMDRFDDPKGKTITINAGE